MLPLLSSRIDVTDLDGPWIEEGKRTSSRGPGWWVVGDPGLDDPVATVVVMGRVGRTAPTGIPIRKNGQQGKSFRKGLT